MRRTALIATLALAGCRVHQVPERELEVALPEAWATPELDDTAPVAHWWRAFDDPRLSALVDEALEHNRDLGAAVARMEQALAQARIAGSTLAPALDANASGARRQQVFVGLPLPGGGVLQSRSTAYGASLDLSWEIDLWGRLRAGRDAADADARAAAADTTGAALSLAAQASKAWFALLEARAQIELAEATARSWQDNADWIRARYERGLASALDLRLALSNTEDARAARAAREDSAQRIARQLEVLLGRYPDAAALGLAEEGAGLPPPPDAPPVGLPATLLERRPDLVAARERLAAADQRVAESKAALLPGLGLTASAGRSSDELEDLLDGDFSVWSVGAGLTAPLFRGGALRAAVDVSEARAVEAWNLYEQRVLGACAEVEAALAAEAWLSEREQALAASTREARAAETLARERYRSGVEELVTLLDAQRRAATNESRWIEVRRERLDNRVDLYLALGGGFDAPAPSEASEEPAP